MFEYLLKKFNKWGVETLEDLIYRFNNTSLLNILGGVILWLIVLLFSLFAIGLFVILYISIPPLLQDIISYAIIIGWFIVLLKICLNIRNYYRSYKIEKKFIEDDRY